MLSSLLLPLISLAVAARGATVDYTFDLTNAQLAPDGFSRATVAVNGGFPGPLITANKGDTLNVLVNNQLTDSSMRKSTSIHWHGLFQHRNAHNDGPSFVTQCPISPEHSYTYSMFLNQTGTYWYHSHLSSQYIDGLRGPIVIKDPQDPHLSLYDVDDESTVVFLADWFHTASSTLLSAYTSSTNSASADQLPQSGTINGVGRTSTDTQPARPVFTVTQGQRYRFRLINGSALTRFNFQIAGHTLTVIEADGENHVATTVDRLVLQPGQRYSVVVTANQPVDNYWIRAPMAARVVGTPPANWATDSDNVNAILRYVGAPATEPTSSPPALSGTVLDEATLVPLTTPAAPGTPVAGGADKVFNLTFAAFTDSTEHGWKVNGSKYVPPTLPTLLQILSGASSGSDFAPSENTLIIEHGDVVEVNIFGVPNHPWHLHGHTFSVVKGATGSVNYVNPPRRDVTPSGGSGGFITIRFTADNPGPWLMHCHIDLHFDAGLAVVFAEAPEQVVAGADSVDPSDAWDELCSIYDGLPESDK